MTLPILKTAAEIEAMRPAGSVVAQALAMIEEMIAPGVTTIELDRAVEELFIKAGGIPKFKDYPSSMPGVKAFPACICASINEEVVHGIPSERVLCEGDIISIDVGVEIDGWVGDAARTFPVGKISRRAEKLLTTTYDSLKAAEAVMKPGVELRVISGAVQAVAESAGFSVVRKFVGHGIGREMHEPPQVPNYVSRLFGEGRMRMEAGAVLAVEPMVNVGGADVRVLKDGWTVITKDRSLSAHFENSIAIGENGPIVLTEV